MSSKTRATIEGLYKVEGNAELVDGEIVCIPPAGDDPNGASLNVAFNLREYEKRTGHGRCSKPRLCATRSCARLGRMTQSSLRPRLLLRIANGRRNSVCETMRQVAARTGLPGPLSHYERRRHLGAMARAGARLLYTYSRPHTSRPGRLMRLL